MKIAYTSDCHLDHFISPTRQHSSLISAVSRYITSVLKPLPADILVIAGDIGHYNQQNIELLRQLKDIYPEVAIVTGNHDCYLISDSQKSKYDWDSFNRLAEFESACTDLGVHVLKGTSTTINGITIGGCPMWYDLLTPADIHNWTQFMNDSRLILQGAPIRLPYSRDVATSFDTQAYYEQQVSLLSSLSDIDVFVSHVIPIIRPDSLQDPRYVGSEYNIFYESDNLDLLQATGASHCIFGHTHIQADFEYEGIRFLASAIGYPQESLPTSISILEIPHAT